MQITWLKRSVLLEMGKETQRIYSDSTAIMIANRHFVLYSV